MRYLFDQDDERTLLAELARHQEKAELISHRYAQQGQARTAAKWAVLAQRQEVKIALLAGIFEHKN